MRNMFLAFDYLYLGAICAMKSQGALAVRVCSITTGEQQTVQSPRLPLIL